jgi:hypothetical protein
MMDERGPVEYLVMAAMVIGMLLVVASFCR